MSLEGGVWRDLIKVNIPEGITGQGSWVHRQKVDSGMKGDQLVQEVVHEWEDC